MRYVPILHLSSCLPLEFLVHLFTFSLLRVETWFQRPSHRGHLPIKIYLLSYESSLLKELCRGKTVTRGKFSLQWNTGKTLKLTYILLTSVFAIFQDHFMQSSSLLAVDVCYTFVWFQRLRRGFVWVLFWLFSFCFFFFPEISISDLTPTFVNSVKSTDFDISFKVSVK